MISERSEQYNLDFTLEKYQSYVEELNVLYRAPLRPAETPIFIDKEFEKTMLSACECVIDTISQSSYHQQSERAIPDHLRVPNEDSHPQFIVIDFGICENEKGELEPQLIELQGFPFMFGWLVLTPEIHRKHFTVPPNYDSFLNGFTKETFVQLFKKIIVGDEALENVILLEIFPHKQQSRVDFYATEILIGIKTVCLSEIIVEGKNLFYMKEEKKIRIKRIYNRVIFDDLSKQSEEIKEKGKLFQKELDVTWLPHPNWFYRISKYSLPFINHPNVPKTQFLNKEKLPNDLENYVVKPIDSYAGQGVIIDVTKEDIDKISNQENYVIQKKVKYALFESPNDPFNVEIRVLYLWETDAKRPVAVTSAARLSKSGNMNGLRYNEGKTWAGPSFCLFQR